MKTDIYYYRLIRGNEYVPIRTFTVPCETTNQDTVISRAMVALGNEKGNFTVQRCIRANEFSPMEEDWHDEGISVAR